MVLHDVSEVNVMPRQKRIGAETEQVYVGTSHDEQQIVAEQKLNLKGGGMFYLIIERDRDGQKEREIIEVKNLITDLGLDIIVRNLINSSPVTLSHIVLSDSSTPTTPDMTTMPGTNKWAQAATVTKPSERTVRWEASWARGAINGTIASIGICSDADGNNLFARVVLGTPKPVGAEDTVSAVYVLSLNRQS